MSQAKGSERGKEKNFFGGRQVTELESKQLQLSSPPQPLEQDPALKHAEPITCHSPSASPHPHRLLLLDLLTFGGTLLSAIVKPDDGTGRLPLLQPHSSGSSLSYVTLSSLSSSRSTASPASISVVRNLSTFSVRNILLSSFPHHAFA